MHVCISVRVCACVVKPWRSVGIRLGLARTINMRCMYSNLGREITKYTVIYGVYIRFWPTLDTTCLPKENQRRFQFVAARPASGRDCVRMCRSGTEVSFVHVQ